MLELFSYRPKHSRGVNSINQLTVYLCSSENCTGGLNCCSPSQNSACLFAELLHEYSSERFLLRVDSSRCTLGSFNMSNSLSEMSRAEGDVHGPVRKSSRIDEDLIIGFPYDSEVHAEPDALISMRSSLRGWMNTSAHERSLSNSESVKKPNLKMLSRGALYMSDFTYVRTSLFLGAEGWMLPTTSSRELGSFFFSRRIANVTAW